jgi:hypothetical protein
MKVSSRIEALAALPLPPAKWTRDSHLIGEVKVKLYVCAHHEDIYGSGHFHAPTSLPMEENLRYPLNSRLGGPHSRFDALVNGNIRCPRWESSHGSSAGRCKK